MRPFKRQRDFLDRLEKVERIMGWDGPNRSGKSYAAAMACTAFITGWPVDTWQDEVPWDLHKLAMGPPRKMGCVTISKAKSIEGQQRFICERIPKYLLSKESGVWNEKTGLGSENPKLVLKNGSTINFLSDVQRAQELEQFQWDMAWIDEAIDEWVYARLIARLTDTGGKIIITSVAEKEWIYRVLRLKLLDREQQIPARPGLIDTLTDTTMFDNELIPRQNIEDSIQMWGGRESRQARMRVFGEYVHLEGVVFPEYQDNDPAIVVPTMSPNGLERTIFEGADPGYRNPFAWVFIAVFPDGSYEMFDEIYERQLQVEDIARLVLSKRAGHGYKEPYVPARIDIAGDQAQHWGRKIVSVRAALQEHGVMTTPTKTPPGSVDAGYQVIRSALVGKRARIQQHCKWLRWEMQTHRYKDPDAKTEEFLRDREAVVDAHNHLIASWRYAITADLRYSPAPSPVPPKGSAAYDVLQQSRAKAAKRRSPWS